MNCKGVQRLLSAYIDRELSGDEMLDIRAHLGACELCRQEADELRDLKRLLSGIEAPEPPSGFEQRLAAKVICDRPHVDTRAPWGRNAMILAGVAACSMAATMVALSTVNRSATSPSRTNGDAIAFEIQRDQVNSLGADPYGAPVMTASASYAR